MLKCFLPLIFLNIPFFSWTLQSSLLLCLRCQGYNVGSNASFGCLHLFCLQGQGKEICKICGLLVSRHTNHRRCQMHASQSFSLIQHMEVGMAKVWAVKGFFVRISGWCTIASITTYQLLPYALRDCVMTKNGCTGDSRYPKRLVHINFHSSTNDNKFLNFISSLKQVTHIICIPRL